MPYYVVNKIMDALNERRKSIKNSKILILGVAYKKDVDDMRESPSLKLIELIKAKGAAVDYHDPYISVIPPLRRYRLNMKSIQLNRKNIVKYDCVVIATDHTVYDYCWLVKHSKMIVDTRNATRDFKQLRGKKIIPA